MSLDSALAAGAVAAAGDAIVTLDAGHGGPVHGPGGMTAREDGAGRAGLPEGPNSRIPAATATRAASEAE